MATSSIIDNIRINNPKVMEAWLDALEASEKNELPLEKYETKAKYVTDPEEMQAIIMSGNIYRFSNSVVI